LIANSFEHAFPNASGTVRVTLRNDPPSDQAVLLIEDDGVGFAELLDATRFGLSLVRRLVKQIRGTVAVHAQRGQHGRSRFRQRGPLSRGGDQATAANGRDA
jgi:two-component sensor histidine kinase